MILFFLSKSLTNLVFRFFYNISNNKDLSVNLMGLFFLIGTIIHELSHGIAALLLFVKVGKMELWPKLHESEIKLGSIQIEKTDPIRRFLIGSAPFLFGIMILLSLFYYGEQQNLLKDKFFILIILYIVFQITNTMFSSKKDMETTPEIIILLLLTLTILHFSGVTISYLNPDAFFSNPIVEASLKKASLFLTIPIVINLGVIGLLKLLK